MMCGFEESTKQWSCTGRGSAYMSCRIGYMYAAGKVWIGGCRIADTQSCIRCYMHIYAAGKVFIGGCAYTGV